MRSDNILRKWPEDRLAELTPDEGMRRNQLRVSDETWSGNPYVRQKDFNRLLERVSQLEKIIDSTRKPSFFGLGGKS